MRQFGRAFVAGFALFTSLSLVGCSSLVSRSPRQRASEAIDITQQVWSRYFAPWEVRTCGKMPQDFADIVDRHVTIASNDMKEFGPTREIVAVVYYEGKQLPPHLDLPGKVTWGVTYWWGGDKDSPVVIYLSVDNPSLDAIWVHELNHARIGDSHHADKSWYARGIR